MSIHLILGGARSGKSSHAEQQAKQCLSSGKEGVTQLHYVATAQAFDEEMKQRIRHHQDQRDDRWIEHEVPINLVETINAFTIHDVVLIDCLTLWLNNVIFIRGDNVTSEAVQSEITALQSALKQTSATVILVSNEVGLGVVPMGKVSRMFVDHAGWMNQKIASIASRVEFIAAGLPMTLKQ
ncbi:bifunctional adenosylcobinamide kinase/adenosylcobinamide-phosphate guanylyltransferase [Vibrio sp. YMD68]|uniref:bifunctional adenosylcobinamide kinase/adenosylcobinamide-phosphate guanylyltransferase n=1 Tax=Vibrio sp. YMD68 TaxID=3042300 RepID=UPI00249B700A|nr:bifunctional adenosylcobinamide kinase/adenosylcobinamide-phosphate guanylyltransferase [Vibrio sp. YMD68]WGV99074.1 bifunctional adenosylcobinamide kinase/adenosylcobinamide-phosphate guanylyltransferase [Vibrio sp. YMD68]